MENKTIVPFIVLIIRQIIWMEEYKNENNL